MLKPIKKRAASEIDVAALARTHTESCITTLAEIVECPDAPHSARIAAAEALLDRAYGRPAQSVQVNGLEGTCLN